MVMMLVDHKGKSSCCDDDRSQPRGEVKMMETIERDRGRDEAVDREEKMLMKMMMVLVDKDGGAAVDRARRKGGADDRDRERGADVGEAER